MIFRFKTVTIKCKFIFIIDYDGNDMYVGYTDFVSGAGRPIVALSGGPIPIPEFGDVPSKRHANTALNFYQ